MRKVVILGTGSYLPSNVVTNYDLSLFVDTSDEWISTRTGIKERRISNKESTTYMAYNAALMALENANISISEIDLIICATMTPDNFMPSVACEVQGRLGATRAAAFDISAACTGMIYAISIGEQFIQNNVYNKVLIIGAETLSKILNWEDRGTCVLFGDGAGAVLLGKGDTDSGIIASKLYADGSKNKILTCPAIPVRNKFINSNKPMDFYMAMEGQEVFKFAIRSITKAIKELISQGGITPEDIKYIVPHQANKRIIEQAAKYSNIPEEKFFLNLERYGNTSAASIGIALDELIREGNVNTGDYIILVGFGGGMTSGAVLLRW